MRILIIIILLLLLSFFSFRLGYKMNQPTVIEVYQGKAVLEYKIVNGIIRDSVVIYKP